MTEEYQQDNVKVDGPFDDDHLQCPIEKLASTSVLNINQLLAHSEQRFADNMRIGKKIFDHYEESEEDVPSALVQPLALAQPLAQPLAQQPTQPLAQQQKYKLDEIASLDNELFTNVKKQELAREQLEQHAIKLQLYYKIYCYPAKTGEQYTTDISVLDQHLINRHYLILQQPLFDLLLETANVFLPEFNTYIVDDRRATERIKITSLVNNIIDCIQTIYTTSVKTIQLTTQMVHAQTVYLILVGQPTNQSSGQLGNQPNQNTDYNTIPDVDAKKQLNTQHQIDNYLHNYMLNCINDAD